MLIRILSNQIREYEDVVLEAIEKTIPEYQEQLKTKLFEELLFGIAQLWVSYTAEGNVFEGVFITKIVEDTACGGKSCVLISGYAPGGFINGASSVFNGWKDLSKFALSQGCDRISMYTNNPEVEKYLHMFDVKWATKFYQLSLDKEN